MDYYATAEYESWAAPRSTFCAWCGRPDGLLVPLMSREHLACKVCYTVWYSYYPMHSNHLREMSLGVVGQFIEKNNLTEA